MSLHHHLDDATLIQYASGDLDEAFATVVAAHLAMCDTCRRAAYDAEEIGGGLLESADAAEMSAGALEEILLKLDAGPDNITRPVKAAEEGDVPQPLVRHLGHHLDQIKWRTIAPGVRKHTIAKTSASKSALYLLHIAPGTAVPEHGHGGAELTLILSGAYADAFGTFGRGDIADLDEHVEHQPQVVGDDPCICLVATEAPTRFKDFFARLLQPLTGI